MAKTQKKEEELAVVPPSEDTALAVPDAEETALAIPDEELDEMFGGPEPPMPIKVAWPEIKMTKTSDFKMPDDTKVQELVGNIVFVQRSRAYWVSKYTGDDNPPDCASDNCLRPNESIEEPFSNQCGEKLCSAATWRKEKDESGGTRNVMDCKESLNMIFLMEGKMVPRFIRVRSYSMNRKSPIAAFFTDCLEKTFALNGKFQTVKVRLSLKEIKVNGFDTSMLQVQKIDTLKNGDPLLPVLIKMFKKVQEEFVVVHKEDPVESDSNDSTPHGGHSEYDPDDGPPEDGTPI